LILPSINFTWNRLYPKANFMQGTLAISP
jgi:hypothetical protein